MILTSENSTTDNGMQIQSTVTLSIEAIGVENRPFRVDARVDGARMYTSHHPTEAEAKNTRERMHAAYLEAHGDKVPPFGSATSGFTRV